VERKRTFRVVPRVIAAILFYLGGLVVIAGFVLAGLAGAECDTGCHHPDRYWIGGLGMGAALWLLAFLMNKIP